MKSTGQPSRDEATRGCKPRPAAVVRAPEQAVPAPERATGEVEERLRSILDDAPMIVYVYDSEGRLLFGDREFERVLGVDRDALIGKTRAEFFSPEDAAVQRAHDVAVLASGGTSRLEETLPQADGKHTFISDKFPLRDREGRVYAVCGISTNITERRRAEEGMRRSDARLAEEQGIYHVGNWEWNVADGRLAWSDEVFRIWARLRRGSPPTTRGFSAGCIRTIAERLSERSTTRSTGAGSTRSNIGLSVRTARSESWPYAVRPRAAGRAERCGCSEPSRTSPSAREPSANSPPAKPATASCSSRPPTAFGVWGSTDVRTT